MWAKFINLKLVNPKWFSRLPLSSITRLLSNNMSYQRNKKDRKNLKKQRKKKGRNQKKKKGRNQKNHNPEGLRPHKELKLGFPLKSRNAKQVSAPKEPINCVDKKLVSFKVVEEPLALSTLYLIKTHVVVKEVWPIVKISNALKIMILIINKSLKYPYVLSQ